MVTMAVSPRRRYSKDSAAHSLTNPVLVDVTTRTALRSNPPVRSSSAMARSRVCSSVRLLSTATNTRIGSFAGSFTAAVISSAVGPEPMKVFPSAPMLSHVTSEPGPPDRSVEVGAFSPPGTLAFAASAWALAAASRPRATTWSRTPPTTTTVSTVAIRRAVFTFATWRPTCAVTHRTRAAMALKSPMNRAITTAAVRVLPIG